MNKAQTRPDLGFTDTQRRSVTGHELGHALGLGHTNTVELMGRNPDNTELSRPTEVDAQLVRQIYP